ncbi:MAG: OB-fold protein [Bacteroidia bacterium]|jgi:hypothetical protein
MKKRLLLIVALLVLAALGYGIYLFTLKAPVVAQGETDFRMSTDQLVALYEQNEDSANRKLLNQIIEVRGAVTTVAQDSTGTSIALSSSNPMSVVNCRFDASINEKLRRVKTGDTISVKGKCTGFLMDVNLTNCDILGN